MTFLLYVIFAAVAALFLSLKTDRKVLAFALIFWLFAQPVLNAKYIIPLPGLPFDLQPNRILFLFSLGYLFLGLLSRKQAPSGAVPPFEKYIHIYLGLVMVALLLNHSFMNWKSVIAIPIEIVTFFTVYTVAKRYMTEKVFEAILKAIILLAAIGALVAIVQIAEDKMFLRTGDLRPAFGNKLRSTGIFQSEYDFGYFQILAVIVSFVRYRGKAIRLLIVPLLMVSLLLTFHRLDYIILFICAFSYLVFFSNRKVPLPIYAVGGVLGILLLFLSFYMFQSMGGRSAMVEERLKQNTVSGRLLQYQLVAKSMLDHPLGLGSYDHPDYVALMSKHGMVQWFRDQFDNGYTRPLAVHNGYLAAGIQYGVLGFIIFVTWVFSMFRYFRKQITPQMPYSLVPFYAVVIYALSNISNSVSIFRAYFVVLLAILGGASIAMQRGALAKKLNPPVAEEGFKRGMA